MEHPERSRPVHPYWCDTCDAHSGFTIPGSPIEHERDCPRYGEDPMEVYAAAVKYCRETGDVIL